MQSKMQNKLSEKQKYMFATILFCLSGVIGAFFLCLISGKNIFNIYIPKGWISDEFSYYKQIEAMVYYGKPLGYFGYDEVGAQHGMFGAWNFLLIMPYAVIGKIIGWHYFTPIICNTFFTVISCIIFVCLVKPEMKKMLALTMAFITFIYYSRYMLSNMTESLVFSIVIIISGIMIRNIKYYSKYLTAVLLALVFYLTVIRPYFAMLFLIMIFQTLYRRTDWKRKVMWIIVILVTAYAGIKIYFFMREYFCSPYFNNDTYNPFGIFAGGFKSSLHNITINLVGCSHGVYEKLFIENMYGDNYAYALYLFLFIMLIISSICSIKTHETSLAIVSIMMASMLFLFYLTVTTLYHISDGARHTMAFSLMAIIVIYIIMENRPVRVITCVGMLVLMLIYIPWHSLNNWIPTADAAEIATHQSIEMKLNEVMQVGNRGWDDTVDIGVADLDLNNAFYIPKGMGIQILSDKYVNLHNAQEYQAKYIMVAPGGKIENKIRSEYQLICTVPDKNFAIYQRK